MKLKRGIAIVALFGMMGSLMAGCSNNEGVTTNSNSIQGGKSDGSGRHIKIMSQASESTDTHKVWVDILDRFCEENPGVTYECELIPNHDQYFEKLRLYIASGDLPDIFKCPNGPISNQLIEKNQLVNVGEELKKIERYDSLNPAMISFLENENDNNLYLFPEGRFAEMFWYWTEDFEALGLEEPGNWDEFLEVCAALKDNGKQPAIIAGKESWQLLRYLSFIPWRTTHAGFINSFKTADASYLESSEAMRGAELLATMGANYFQPGFTNTDFTDSLNMFLGHQGTIYYAGSDQLANFKDLYEKGEIAYFPVPESEGQENIPSNFPVHAGLAYGFNANTYDETMQKFFEFLAENYNDTCYNVGNVFSPFDLEVPDGMSQLVYDIAEDLEKVDDSWVSWDDKLDSATTVTMGDMAGELGIGMVNPEEFAKEMDKAVAKNISK